MAKQDILNQQNVVLKTKTGRRGFLKVGATVSAAFLAAPSFANSSMQLQRSARWDRENGE
jgi:hypothetical protein